jgi:hypothetical protein
MSDSSLTRFLADHSALNRASSQAYTSAIWGGVAQEFDTLQDEVDLITVDALDAYDLSGTELDEFIVRFSGINRLTGQADSDRKALLSALYYRAGLGSWMTAASIKAFFSYFFDADLINIIENAVVTNLITDGTFESFVAGTMTAAFGSFSPSGASIALISTGVYGGSVALHGIGTGSVKTSAAATAGCYIVSCAYRGYCPLIIQRSSDSYYYNFTSASWTAALSETLLANKTDEYVTIDLPIMVDGSYTVSIIFGPDSTGRDYYLDNISFGVKPSYPYINILVNVYSGTSEFLSAFPAGTDPITGDDYVNAARYFGVSYVGGYSSGGTSLYYQELLDMIRPAGVKGLFSFIGRVS